MKKIVLNSRLFKFMFKFMSRFMSGVPLFAVALLTMSMFTLTVFGGVLHGYDVRLMEPQKSHVTFRHLTVADGLSTGGVYSIFQDKIGLMWFGTSVGLNKYDGYEVTVYRHDPGDAGSISQDFILKVCADPAGRLWAVTLGGDVNQFIPETETFVVYKNNGETSGGSTTENLRAVYAAPMGILWLFHRDGRVTLFDMVKTTRTPFEWKDFGETNPRAAMPGAVYQDDNGNYWFGTLLGELRKYDKTTGRMTNFTYLPPDFQFVSFTAITGIMADGEGMIWLSHWGEGCFRFNPQNGKTIHYKRTVAQVPNMMRSFSGFYRDTPGNIRLATIDQGMFLFEPKSERFYHYPPQPGRIDGPRGQNINCIYEDNTGLMWVGSERGGVDIYRPLNTSTGPGGGNSKTTAEGDADRDFPPVVFTGLFVSNKRVTVADGSALEKSINLADKIVLSHHDRMFKLTFAALDYNDPSGNRYMYKMENMTQDWVPLEKNRRSLQFVNLKPGEYVLTVKGSDHKGNWGLRGTSVNIIVTPPYWATWWFRVTILILMGLLFQLWHKRKVKSLTLKYRTGDQLKTVYKKYKITNREEEILELILKGKSNKDIEDILFISLSTVKAHIYSIYKKLGVKSRLELVNFLQRKPGSMGDEG